MNNVIELYDSIGRFHDNARLIDVEPEVVNEQVRSHDYQKDMALVCSFGLNVGFIIGLFVFL